MRAAQVLAKSSSALVRQLRPREQVAPAVHVGVLRIEALVGRDGAGQCDDGQQKKEGEEEQHEGDESSLMLQLAVEKKECWLQELLNYLLRAGRTGRGGVSATWRFDFWDIVGTSSIGTVVGSRKARHCYWGEVSGWS